MAEGTMTSTRRSEREITADVHKTESYLRKLYAERRGRVCEPPDGQVLVNSEDCWAWCCGCGANRVHVGGGDDTCDECLKNM